jgi:hypothetical protein
MPGIVKVGRTQDWPHRAIANLYSAGVPERFLFKAIRFFVDCYTAEDKILAALHVAGIPCTNKGFFKIEEKIVEDILAENYSSQHIHHLPGDFQLEAHNAFEKALNDKQQDWAQLIAGTFRCLPHEEREEELMHLLAKAMELGAQECAEWLVSNCGVDPEMPLPLDKLGMMVDSYRLTAYENAIFLGQARFEKYLEGAGCNLSNSSALCWVVDCLINSYFAESWKRKILEFGLELLKREPNLNRILDAELFSEAPLRRNSHPFRYDIFPRSSGKSCREVIEMYAYLNPYFAELHKAM